MKNIPVGIQDQLDKRAGIMVRNFAWFSAKNRDTGEVETLGVWNGDDTQSFIVDGVSRVYVGAGGMIALGLLKQSTGLFIRNFALNVSQVSPEMAQLIRTYDAKLAPVEVHQGFFNPETNELVAPLQRIFKGWINTMPLTTAAKNTAGSLTINMVSHTRLLTKVVPLRRSHETQIRRQADDAFFRNVSITGTMQVAWGSKTAGAGGSGSGVGFSGNLLNTMIKLAMSRR